MAEGNGVHREEQPHPRKRIVKTVVAAYFVGLTTTIGLGAWLVTEGHWLAALWLCVFFYGMAGGTEATEER